MSIAFFRVLVAPRRVAAFALGCLMAVQLAAGLAKAETQVELVETQGGITAYLVNEPAVPLLAMTFQWRGGAAADPLGAEGLSRMVAGLLDEGAGELDSLAFRTVLEDQAIRLGFSP